MPAGRPPKPTALKVIAGTDQPCRVRNDEPKPKANNVKPPRNMNRRAKAIFRQLADQLLDCKVMTDIDVVALGMLAVAILEMNDIQKDLEKTGVMVRGRNGYPVISPLFRAARHKQADVKAMLIEFGMTPSSRTRVGAVTDPGDKGKWNF